MTAKKNRVFTWGCGAAFEARLVRGDRTKLEYRQINRTNKRPYEPWRQVDLGRAIAFAYGANIPAKGRNAVLGEYWTPLGNRTMADMLVPRVSGWRATTFQVLKYLGVVTK